METVIYTSKCGHTARYATLLSEKLETAAVELGKAKSLEKVDTLIFVSWVRAGKIVGLDKAKAIDYRRLVVVADGITPPGERYEKKLMQDNGLEKDLFYLPGGLDLSSLRGLDRLVMKMLIFSMKHSGDENEKRLGNLLSRSPDGVDPSALERVLKAI